MLQERLNNIREELLEVEHLPELKAIWCHWEAEAPEVANDAECVLMLKSTISRLRLFCDLPSPQETVVEQAATPTQPKNKPPVVRGTRRYQLLDTEVRWTQKPQVHAIMQILGAHASPGDVLDEDDIVRMMEANVSILNTTQKPKRIFDYYKGDHNEGLTAHGNLRRV